MNKNNNIKEDIDQLEVIVKYQMKYIDQLQEKVKVLEEDVEQLKNNRPTESRILEPGVEYISIIEDGSSYVDRFEWEEMLWNKYLLKLNGITELYELIIPLHKRQPVIGDCIKHYVIGKTIKTWRYVKNKLNEE